MVRRPQKPPIRPQHPDAIAYQTVPMSHEKLVGRFVIEWAKLEATMDDVIWNFLNLPIEYGRIVTSHMDTTGKTKMLRQLSETSFGHSYPDYALHSYICELLDHVDIIRIDRNLIVHGTWGRHYPTKVPMSLSLKIKDKPSTVVSETFDDIRMRQLVDRVLAVKWSLIALFDPARASHHRSREQFQRSISNPQPNHEDQPL